MRRTLPGIALMLALTLGGTAADETCWTTTQADLVVPDATGDAGGDYYVDGIALNDVICYAHGDLVECGGIWIYQESNGLPGLQRHDEIYSDIIYCSDGTKGDTIIF